MKMDLKILVKLLEKVYIKKLERFIIKWQKQEKKLNLLFLEQF